MAPAKRLTYQSWFEMFSASQMAPAKRTSERVMRLLKISRTITIGSFDSRADTTMDKEKYSEMEDVAANLQKVFFTGERYVSGQVLDYKTKDGSSVHMNLQAGYTYNIHVEVSWSGKSIQLFVCDLDTIGDLKIMIQEIEGIPANQVTLIGIGKQLEDFDTLAAYSISPWSILYAVLLGEENIKIFIKMPGKESIKFEVKQCSSVETIKTMFHCMVGFPIDQQKLTFNGVLLENDLKLSDYKIKMESVLDMAYLAPGLMKIYVKKITGTETFAFFTNSSDTIVDVKKKVQYVTGVNHVRQILTFAGQRLEKVHYVTVLYCLLLLSICEKINLEHTTFKVKVKVCSSAENLNSLHENGRSLAS